MEVGDKIQFRDHRGADPAGTLRSAVVIRQLWNGRLVVAVNHYAERFSDRDMVVIDESLVEATG